MISWIYKNNETNTARYALGERAEKMIACIGINPSTAKPNYLDNTLRSVKRIAGFNGYNGWVMYNVYPQRTTDPKQLHQKFRQAIQKENIRCIVRSARELQIDSIWLACGNLIESRDYFPFCLFSITTALKEFNITWKIAGDLTKKGHPRHPLYLPAHTRLSSFDMKKYVMTRYRVNK